MPPAIAAAGSSGLASTVGSALLSGVVSGGASSIAKNALSAGQGEEGGAQKQEGPGGIADAAKQLAGPILG